MAHQGRLSTAGQPHNAENLTAADIEAAVCYADNGTVLL